MISVAKHSCLSYSFSTADVAILLWSETCLRPPDWASLRISLSGPARQRNAMSTSLLPFHHARMLREAEKHLVVLPSELQGALLVGVFELRHGQNGAEVDGDSRGGARPPFLLRNLLIGHILGALLLLLHAKARLLPKACKRFIITPHSGTRAGPHCC